MRFDQLNMFDAVLAIAISVILIAVGAPHRDLLHRQVTDTVVPATAVEPPLVAVAAAPVEPVQPPTSAPPASPPRVAKPVKPTKPAGPRTRGPGDAALQEALDHYAGGDFEAALQKAEEAIGRGAKAALRIAAMSACKLGQHDQAMRYARSLRGRDLSQFRDACPDALAAPPRPETTPDAAPADEQLEAP